MLRPDTLTLLAMKTSALRLLYRAILPLTISFFVFSFSLSYAQAPTVQDCLGAIPVCQDTYVQNTSYYGSGNYPNEVFNPSGDCTTDCPGSCLDGEQNSVWYVFTVQVGGMLRLTIDPFDDNDDYDWAVYDITALRCDQIYSQYPLMQKSCNAWGSSGVNGNTGINTANGGVGNCNHCGEAGSHKWNADLPVTAGRTYVLLIENWGSPTGGYTLDFSASDAIIYDNVRPTLSTVNSSEITCGDTEIKVNFSENVVCETVDPTDFILTGPGGPYNILDVQGQTCMLGGDMEKTYTLIIDRAITTDGDYAVELIPLSFVADACNNYALGNTVTFNVSLGAPVINTYAMVIQTATCGISNGSITGIVVTGNSPFTYQWTNEAGTPVGNQLDLLNVPTGNYTLSVNDPNTCITTSGPHFIDQTGAPQFDDSGMTITSATYGANNGAITGITVTGTPPLTYAWMDPYYTVVGTNLDLTNVYADIYSLTITDTYGCDTIAGPYFIPEIGGPVMVTPQATPMTICLGGSTQLNAQSTGGTGIYTYSWSSVPPGFSSDIQSPLVYPTVTTTYNVSISDGYNIATGSVTVTVNPLPFSDAGTDITIPYGTSTTIYGSAGGGSGDYNYFWEPASQLITSNVPNPATKNLYSTTVFVLYVTDQNTGCTSTTDTMIVFLEGGPLGVTLSTQDDTICKGESTIITAYGFGGNYDHYTYTWTEGTTVLKIDENPTSTLSVSPIIPGNHLYTVSISDNFNTFSGNININVAPSPQFTIDPGSTITACPLDSVVLKPSHFFPGATYYWSNGSTEPTITVGTTGIGFEIRTMNLTITNAEGCTYSDTATIVFDFSTCSGISEANENDGFYIYPNPTTGKLTVEFTDGMQFKEVDIIDIHGVVVQSETLHFTNPGQARISIDLAGLTEGIYFLKAVHEHFVKYEKVIVNR